MSGHSFDKMMKCRNCDFEFVMTFIASDGKEVDSISPENCPRCWHEIFIGRFKVDPENWIGSFGSNG